MNKNLKISIIVVFCILLAIIVARYITDDEFRKMVDIRILKKELQQDTLSTIEINYESSPNIFAYDKYIAILNKNVLDIYLGDGSKETSIDINITKPIIYSRGKYLVIAEQDGKNIYLLEGSNIAWKNSVEGDISRVSVNKNGYVSVIVTNTTYKSVIVSFNPSGKELFRTYLSSTYAICTDISNNNKYLAIGEVDYSGTIVKSNVKIISIALAQTEPKQSVVNKYESENGEIVRNVKYQDKDSVLCIFNSYIQKVGLQNNERYLDIDNNALFLDMTLKDKVIIIEKQSSGLFSYEYGMKLKSTNSSAENLYILDSDVPKGLIVSSDLIGIHLGTEIQIVNSKGILLKKYKSKQEIKNLVIGSSIAGVVYKDKIELINL